MPTAKRLPRAAIATLLVTLCLASCLAMSGCKLTRDVEHSWNFASWAASEVQRGEASELCRRFSQEMLAAVSCVEMARLLDQVRAVMGEPVDECRWAYTYRVAALDPFVATSVRSCPFSRGDLTVTVAAEIAPDHQHIVGLWLDSPAIRDLDRTLDSER